MSDDRVRNDFTAPPWWTTPPSDDYTKHRTGAITYTMDDLIGRKDTNKFTLVTSDVTTVSGNPGTVLI